METRSIEDSNRPQEGKYGWKSESYILSLSKKNPMRLKMGLGLFYRIGILERQLNPDTNEYEYRISQRGAKFGLSWKNIAFQDQKINV